jgi:hypothetical protein
MQYPAIWHSVFLPNISSEIFIRARQLTARCRRISAS